MAEEPIWMSLGEFVTEGVMAALPLCFPGQSSPPPAGETAIRCMAVDPLGTVYCGTAGRRGHVLAAMIRGDTGVVFDLGCPPEAERIDALAVVGEHVCAIASGPGGCAMWRWQRMARSFLIQEWTLPRVGPEKVGELAIDGRVADAVAPGDGSVLYGVAEPGGELFRLEAATAEAAVLAKLDEEQRFSRRIALGPDGRLWGTRGMARIFRCDTHTGALEDVAVIPAAAGRAQHTQASAWAADPAAARLYGGTTPDGFLFRLDPHTGRAVGLGKPTRLGPVNCLTVGNDGRLFGACGLGEDIGHLFCHDPDAGSLRDLGIAVSAITARQYGYHFQCMATGRDGEIYLGQHERVGHLWVYFPPVPTRSGHAGA